MFKIYDGRDSFWQWDLNQKLIVSDPTVEEVHFCNKTDDCSLVVEVRFEDGVRVADVPNVLLQSDWIIRAYAYTGTHTLVEDKFKVNPRTKPADYIYTETEVKRYEDLEEEVKTINKKLNELSVVPRLVNNETTNCAYVEAVNGGGVKLIKTAKGAAANTLVVRGADKELIVRTNPQLSNEAVSKGYVDNITGDIDNALDEIIALQNGYIEG